MFRFLLVIVSCCLIAPALSYSKGAPAEICMDLKPKHGVDGEASSPPHTLTGANTVKGGDSISITLQGQGFKGFVVQARDVENKPIGEFKIIDSKVSQILNCGGPNTVTHKKIEDPIKRVEFSYTAPHNYHGKVKFVATVVESSFKFWVGKVIKEIEVQ